MNFRERLELSRGKQDSDLQQEPQADLEDNYTCDYFATDNIKSLPACLDLRLPDGDREFVPYSIITGISYKKAEGITITCSTKKIIITGRNMEKLLDYLGAYRVRYITANLGSEVEGDGVFVKEISIEQI